MKSILAMDYLSLFWDLLSGARARSELSAAERRRVDCAEIFCSKPLKILDLGNGALRPQSYILANEGHNVTGVDLINAPRLTLKSIAYSLARIIFCAHLPRKFCLQGKLLLVAADATALPLHDESFDLITSFAAFEHFLEIDKVVRECFRVLRPGGMIWAGIHCFPSLSGGHNVGRRRTRITALPPGVEPWDHLRQRKVPFTVSLNELRPNEYREIFAKYFDVLRAECVGTEGEEFLTPEIERELSEFTRDELLCACYLLCARKRL